MLCPNRSQQLRIQQLEATVRVNRKTSEDARKFAAVQSINIDHAKEREGLVKAREALLTENDDLRDQLEEVHAMVEHLKAQVSNRKGLLSAVGNGSRQVAVGGS